MVIDTGIFIDFLRAKDKSKTQLYDLSNETKIFISSVTLYELYIGATSPQKWLDVKMLTEDIPVLSFTKSISEKSAMIYQQL
ncbi:type II toxin-antitoxin system VapC family toxin [Aquiflexum sp.]|uniref:type II toxin-antitoxin system VapC family toxin n=1 Tax=Aquiflexum sp. TaxID=1872584 RepID=UPI0035946BC5